MSHMEILIKPRLLIHGEDVVATLRNLQGIATISRPYINNRRKLLKMRGWDNSKTVNKINVIV